jgi:hypothetical protein
MAWWAQRCACYWAEAPRGEVGCSAAGWVAAAAVAVRRAPPASAPPPASQRRAASVAARAA